MFKKTTALAALLGLLCNTSAFGFLTYIIENHTNEKILVDWGINVAGSSFGTTHFYCAKEAFSNPPKPVKGAEGLCGPQSINAQQTRKFQFYDVACMTPELFTVGTSARNLRVVEIKSLPNEARDKMDDAVAQVSKSVGKAGTAAGESGIKQAKAAEAAGKIISETIKAGDKVGKASTCKSMSIIIVNDMDADGKPILGKFLAYTFGIR